jgi:hypothetical protein
LDQASEVLGHLCDPYDVEGVFLVDHDSGIVRQDGLVEN